MNLNKYWDKKVVKDISSFSGWNFLTAITYLFTIQGLGVVLNHFFGTVANAAQGIANQVNSQLSSFSANLMKALNPVIVKTTASSDSDTVNLVTLTGCKISTLLIIFFAIPVMLKMHYILNLWLKEVPEWTVLFCRLQLIYTIITQVSNPAATAVYGNGNIKYYAIFKSIMNIIPIILTYFSFALGGNPIWLYIPLIVFMGIGGDIVIINYAHKLCAISSAKYISNVILPLLGICIMMVMFGGVFSSLTKDNFLSLIGCCFITSLAMILGLIWFGFSNYEKSIIKQLYNAIIQRLKKI